MAPATATPTAPTVTPVGGKETEPVAPVVPWTIAHAADAKSPLLTGPQLPYIAKDKNGDPLDPSGQGYGDRS